MKLTKTAKKLLFVAALLLIMAIILYYVPEKKNQFSSPHFTFIFSHSIDPSKIKALANALEECYSPISEHLNVVPASHIETNIYAARWRYGKATGLWLASGNIEWFSKLHFLEQPWGEDSKKVAIHEFTHAVVLKKLFDREPQPIDSAAFEQKFAAFPIWLWEAISCYEAGQVHELKNKPYLANGKYPSLQELNSRKGSKIYATGYSMIEFILEKYGREKLNELIVSYGNLTKVLHVTEEEFSSAWYDFVKARYLQNE